MRRQLKNSREMARLLTCSTTSNPPLNHLYLLNLSLCHTSNLLTTSWAPSPFPSSVRTTQARGTCSSDIRAFWGTTPATTTSEMRGGVDGWARRVSSISVGETCLPETFRVSCHSSIVATTSTTRTISYRLVTTSYLHPIYVAAMAPHQHWSLYIRRVNIL